MNYMERTYKDYLQGASGSMTLQQYYYRQYYGSNAYLGIDNNSQHLVYIGALSGNSFLDLGAVSAWLPQSGCSSSAPGTAVTTSFYNFNYLQNVNGVPVATGTIVDKGANVAGTVTFGAGGTTAAFTPQLNGEGYSWGSPMSYGNGYGSNPKDRNVPAVAAICQWVAGTGSARGKLTDVLVTKEATRLTSASQLANIRFTAYAEDCEVKTQESFVFDEAGNAVFSGFEDGRQVSHSVDASQLTNALNGTPIADGEFTVFTAYSYVDSQSGRTRYVMVEHGSDKPSGLSRGYLGIWLEDFN